MGIKEQREAAERAVERDIERQHYEQADKEDRVALDTPARGASPRPWRRGWPDGSGMEHILDENNEPLLTTWSMYAADDGFKTPKKVEVDALDRAVLAVNSYDAHLALMRRALDACYGDTWQTCNPNHLADWAQEIRAALAGAER